MATPTFYDIFAQINKIPRPSHHEERIADWLCQWAEKHNLDYRRDKNNCVVIEKPASPGCEDAPKVVILNHMDMVCVAADGYLRDGRPFDPMSDEIIPYVETDANGHRWMKARGTSLGADNGMGLSMALAVLADDTLIHPALEVLTTTNEEDGMSGAEGLSLGFIEGRRILNLDSEAYDEITVGAAGAQLQIAHWTPQWKTEEPGRIYRRIIIDGGLGGHSGVDINKGRCNCNQELARFVYEHVPCTPICEFNGGTANASIAAWAQVVVSIEPFMAEALDRSVLEWAQHIKEKYAATDPGINVRIEDAHGYTRSTIGFEDVLGAISELPCNMIAMRDDMPGTVMTSNNIGMVRTTPDGEVTVSCHTRSFDNDEMHRVAAGIKDTCMAHKAQRVDCLMDTGSWMEKEDCMMVNLACDTFKDVLGFEPRRVAMHFVLESAYYVEKYPGVEMASIGPRILEPHSTSERIDLDTADDIWRVTVELLRRLAK